MKKLFLSCLLVVFSVAAVHAQMAKVVTAYNLLNEYNLSQEVESLTKAKDAIDEATENEKSKAKPKTWLYAGQIYTALAMLPDNANLSEGAVDKAYNAFDKVMELEKADGLSGKKARMSKDAIEGIFGLKGIFYAVGLEDFNAENYAEAYQYFQKSLAIADLVRNNPFGKSNKELPIDTNVVFATALSAERANMDEAIPLLQQLVDMNYDEPSIYQVLTRKYREAGDEAKAEAVGAKAKELYPDNTAFIIDDINRLLDAGKDAEAMEKIKEAVNLDPENAGLQYALGAAYDKSGDPDMAVGAYQKAIDIRPDYYEAYYNLGAVYYNTAAEKVTEMNELPLDDQAGYDLLKKESEDSFGKALPYFEKAQELNADDVNNLIALKEIYARLGMNDKYTAVSDKLKALQER